MDGGGGKGGGCMPTSSVEVIYMAQCCPRFMPNSQPERMCITPTRPVVRKLNILAIQMLDVCVYSSG